MVHANIIIQEYGDPPLFPKLKPGDITKTELTDFIVLQGGMASGKTSISFFLKDADGKVYFAQTSGSIFQAVAATLNGAEQQWKEKGN